MPVHLDENTPLSDVDRAAILDGLRHFNHQHMPASEPCAVELALRDDSGAVLGGLLGYTRWHWLTIHTLWIADGYRRQGHGRALMERAEATAVARGCVFAAVDTTSFQAINFYRRRGYEVFGEQPDYPPGCRTFYLMKKLHGLTESPVLP